MKAGRYLRPNERIRKNAQSQKTVNKYDKVLRIKHLFGQVETEKRSFGFKRFCINSKYPKKGKGLPFCNIEKFSKKRHFLYTLYPEVVISGLR